MYEKRNHLINTNDMDVSAQMQKSGLLPHRPFLLLASTLKCSPLVSVAISLDFLSNSATSTISGAPC